MKLPAVKLPVRSMELLLKYEEYVDTWTGIIRAFYERIISDDAVFSALGPDREHAARFSMELSTVLLVMAMRAWKGREFKPEAQQKVEGSVVRGVYRELLAQDEETLSACCDFYMDRSQMFRELAPLSAAKDEQALRTQMIGFARYAAAQSSQRTEKENAGAIEALSVHLLEAQGAFARLTKNTTLDGNSLFGKNMRFIVCQ